MESNKKISVAKKNKIEASSLCFLLKTLSSNYFGEIPQIIVIDNFFTDSSKEIALKYGVDFGMIENFF